jgi:sulfite reductase alpha subunit-like flavoprotein
LTVLGENEDKETIHLEFELPDAGMEYIVGDSLGVIANNLAIEVDLVLQALGVQASYEIKTPSWKHQLPGVSRKVVKKTDFV